MAGKGTSKRKAKPPCRRSWRIAALYRTTNQVQNEHEVIAISSDSELQTEGNKDVEAEAGEVPPIKEGIAEENLPKNDVYDALWAMLDAESDNDAEEIQGQWDLDNVLDNWGRNAE
ncbi:hypothetical protein PIB30_015505 [Stylosanthes scabra]|uniref:Uncharacterized protein n=1 Tax=Stylosanthes scabra TaxID=79078 RepID=A0ABU6X5D3_9FABA|nr:hypothetical protein [Stylosanthes scabra]